MILPRPNPGMIYGGPSVQPVPPPVQPKGTPTGPQYGPQVGPVDPSFNVNPQVGPVPPSPMPTGPSSPPGMPPVALPPGLSDVGPPMIDGTSAPSPRERLAAALIGKQQEVQHPMQAIGNAASMMAQAYSDKRQKEAGSIRNKMPTVLKGPPKYSPPTKPAAYSPPRPSNPWPKG